MTLLLDTHVFLWFISDNARLLGGFRDAIRDPNNSVYLSVAAVWEAIIKHGLGRLPLPAPPGDYLPQQRDRHRIVSLPIEEAALTHLAKLPPLHRDPFDRIMVAQAIQHDLTLITVDEAMRAYPVKLLTP